MPRAITGNEYSPDLPASMNIAIRGIITTNIARKNEVEWTDRINEMEQKLRPAREKLMSSSKTSPTPIKRLKKRVDWPALESYHYWGCTWGILMGMNWRGGRHCLLWWAYKRWQVFLFPSAISSRLQLHHVAGLLRMEENAEACLSYSWEYKYVPAESCTLTPWDMGLPNSPLGHRTV